MSPDQQLKVLGISAEEHDGHVIIQTDRTFMMLTPREVEVVLRPPETRLRGRPA